MKKTKIIIPAMGMLLLGTAASVTGTVAWFSANTTVSASGMQISAQVPTQLLIKGSAVAAEYKSEINFSASADSAVNTSNSLSNVPPVAYKSSTGVAGVPTTFYKLTNAAMKNVKADGYLRNIYDETGASITNYTDFTKVFLDSAHTIAAFEAATARTHYLQDSFTLKYSGELSATNDNLKVSVSISTQATVEEGTLANAVTIANVSPIYKALHMVFVQNTNAYEIDFSTASLDTSKTTVAGTTASVVLNVNDVRLADFTANNQEKAYTLYVFYDGEDADCINDNSVDVHALNFNLDFELYNAL